MPLDSTPDPFARPDWRQSKIESPGMFAAITAILFRHDPIGINFGLNTDEYEPEAGTILPRLADCRCEAEVCRVVHEELCRWFGDVDDRAEYAPIARELWELCQVSECRCGEPRLVQLGARHDSGNLRARKGAPTFFAPGRVLPHPSRPEGCSHILRARKGAPTFNGAPARPTPAPSLPTPFS